MPQKRNIWTWRLLAILAWVGPIGCSDVAFESLPNSTCLQFQREFGANGCVPDNGTGFNNFNYKVSVGEVDIVFVDDNSGSMYTEQVEMANKFPGFLDSIFRLDYRLAIMTTDVTSNAGGFLSFSNGAKVLANSSRSKDATHSQNITMFQQSIKRSETLTCDTSNYSNCPSGDERGIYALNASLERGDQRSFFRPGGHLAVVILSDEDERSNGGNIPGYPLETLDLPLTFAQRTKQFLGQTKTVSVHSIIIKPNDASCLSAQNNQAGVKGYVGNLYAQLSQPNNQLRAAGNLVDGALGSICSTNYTTELGNIAAKINQTLKTVQLPCRPFDDVVNVSFDPAPAQQIYYTIDADNRLQLSSPAEAGTQMTLAYKCKI